jgi:hypothetical protein
MKTPQTSSKALTFDYDAGEDHGLEMAKTTAHRNVVKQVLNRYNQ